MTTIAIVKTKTHAVIATDSQVSGGGYKEIGIFTKIFEIKKIPTPILFASAGSVLELQWMKIFLEKYFQPIQNSNEVKLLTTVDNVLEMMGEYVSYVRRHFNPGFDETENEFVFVQGTKIFRWDGSVCEVDKFTALGSGYAFAMGSLSHKDDPSKAVKIACKYDAWSHEPVKLMKYKLAKPKV